MHLRNYSILLSFLINSAPTYLKTNSQQIKLKKIKKNKEQNYKPIKILIEMPTQKQQKTMESEKDLQRYVFKYSISDIFFYNFLYIYTQQTYWMQLKPNQQIVLLFNINSSKNEAEFKSQLIKDLEQYAKITQKDILLQFKDGKFSAFVRLLSQAATKLCTKQEIQLSENLKANARIFYADFQIFINKLSKKINKQDVQKHFEKFGKINSVQITDSHSIQHEQKIVVVNRHCYIRFEKDQDAEKCIMSGNQHIGDQDLRVVRNYKIGESEQTDKKIFVKVVPNVTDVEAFQQIINQKFAEIGPLRERIRIQSKQNTTNFHPIYLTQYSFGKAMQTFHSAKIGDYILTLRRYISPSKDANRIFLSGLRANISESDLEKAFSVFGKVYEQAVLSTKKPNVFNAVVTFQTEEAMKIALLQAREKPQIQKMFYGQPYITVHMSLKQRKEYDTFNRKNTDKPIKASNWNPPFNMQHMGMQPLGMQPIGMQPMNVQPMGMQPLGMQQTRPNQPQLNFNQPIMGGSPPGMAGMGNKISPNFQMKPNTQN